jgi:hypothetical protein
MTAAVVDFSQFTGRRFVLVQKFPNRLIKSFGEQQSAPILHSRAKMF